MDIEDRKPYPLHPPDEFALKYSSNTAELRVIFKADLINSGLFVAILHSQFRLKDAEYFCIFNR